MPKPIFPSRRVRPSPFHDRVLGAGVQGFTVYNHMLLPTSFAGVVADYHHLKAHVQLWDVAAERQVQIKGPDAHRLACMMSARDLSNAKLGQGYYAPICDINGGLINDPIALRVADDCFWFSIADSDLILWAMGWAQALDMDVQICEPDVSPLAVQGPKAQDVMAAVFGPTIRDLKFFAFQAFEFAGRHLNIARSGWSKQGGFEIYLDDNTLAHQLWDAIWGAGQDFNIKPGCPNLIERVESGLLSYGNDMTRDDTPLEIGLDRYCSLDNDVDFIGKTALLRQRDAGVQKRLMGMVIEDADLPHVQLPWVITNGGMVTSGVYSPDCGAFIGNVMLPVQMAVVDHIIQVQTPKGMRDARVCKIGDYC